MLETSKLTWCSSNLAIFDKPEGAGYIVKIRLNLAGCDRYKNMLFAQESVYTSYTQSQYGFFLF